MASSNGAASNIPRPVPSRKVRAERHAHHLLIVCPTEYGGQIEHAAELGAAALRGGTVDSCTVLTRPGAKESMRGWETDALGVRELLLPRREGSPATRALRQLSDVRSERRIIRSLITELEMRGSVSVLWESTKYGLVTGGGLARHVVFVHNALPHRLHQMGVRDRWLFSMEKRTARGADLVAVHGHRQHAMVSEWGAREVAAVPLPGDTRYSTVQPSDAMDYALCIGEVRPNKGIEIAIRASAESGTRLVVLGVPESQTYADQLSRIATAPTTSLDFRYTDAQEFNSRLAAARLIVLPYIHFAAQSGVLAKAMQFEREIVASDLPALREQAAHYPRITFFQAGDAGALARVLSDLNDVEEEVRAPTSGVSTEQQWEDVAAVLFA